MKSRRRTEHALIALVTVLSLFSIILITGCASASEISAVPPGSLVVDVRTPSEFADWHYPGAINIPVQVLDQKRDQLGDKRRAIIVYCRSGNRSSKAKEILTARGFTNVKNGGGVKDMQKFLNK